jgi:hypothetical protein
MLKNIKKVIKKNGYICHLREDNLLVCGIDNGWSELLDCQLLSHTFSIHLENEYYVLDYTRAQVREIERFNNEDKLVTFIKEIKPI